MRLLAVVGVLALLLLLVYVVPGLLPEARTQWSKIQPPRCATASDCVLANNSCCSNQSGNWTCAALDAHCAPNYAAIVRGCWCGSGLCAANYSCEPVRPTATVELPPFPPEDLEASATPTPNAEPSVEASVAASAVASVVPSVTASTGAGLANPASVYCGEKGGSLEIGDTSQGQVGYCFFVDYSVCEEWAFFRGECVQGACKYYCGGTGSSSEGLYDCNDALLVKKTCA